MKNTITVKHGRKITIEELLNINSCIVRKSVVILYMVNYAY